MHPHLYLPLPLLLLLLSLTPFLTIDQVGIFIDNTPNVDGTKITLSIRFSSAVLKAMCSLTGQQATDCKYSYCSKNMNNAQDHCIIMFNPALMYM